MQARTTRRPPQRAQWSSEYGEVLGFDFNGTYNSYAIAAYDHAGNESELSWEYVVDVPRPEGYDLRLEARTDEIRSRVAPEEPHRLRALLEGAVGSSPEIRHALVEAVGHSEIEVEELRALGYVE